VCVDEPEQAELGHEAWRQRRRRLGLHHFREQVPSALRRVEFELKRQIASVVQDDSDAARHNQQEHHDAHGAKAGPVRFRGVPREDDEAHCDEAKRHELPTVLVVAEQQELDAGPGETEDQEREQ